MRANVLELFSGIPGLDLEKVQKILGSAEIPFGGILKLAPGVSLNIKPLGN